MVYWKKMAAICLQFSQFVRQACSLILNTHHNGALLVDRLSQKWTVSTTVKFWGWSVRKGLFILKPSDLKFSKWGKGQWRARRDCELHKLMQADWLLKLSSQIGSLQCLQDQKLAETQLCWIFLCLGYLKTKDQRQL